MTNPTFAYDANGNMISGGGRTIGYTSYNMASQIAQGTTGLGLAYGAWHGRYKMCVPNCTSPTSTTYYLYDPATGGMSEKVVSGPSVTWRDYIVVPGGGLVALRINDGTTTSWRYAVADHLGSISAITDTAGPPPNIERDSYDTWGKRRNADGSDNAACSITSQTTRGYTSQEMLDSVCLINMNARIQDPQLGRFESADSVVSYPGYGQSYNRYAYVVGNPMRFTDPTGHVACWQDGINVCGTGTRLGGNDWDEVSIGYDALGFASGGTSPGAFDGGTGVYGGGYFAPSGSPPDNNFQDANGLEWLIIYSPYIWVPYNYNIPVTTGQGSSGTAYKSVTPVKENRATGCNSSALANGLVRWGKNFSYAGGWVGLGGANVAVAGFFRAGPEGAAPGLLGVTVGETFSSFGNYLQLMGATLQVWEGDESGWQNGEAAALDQSTSVLSPPNSEATEQLAAKLMPNACH